MSLSYSPTIDDLLADSLIQSVMRADHVEPQALRSLMQGVAGRVGAGSRGATLQRPAVLIFVGAAERPMDDVPRISRMSRPAPARRIARPRHGLRIGVLLLALRR